MGDPVCRTGAIGRVVVRSMTALVLSLAAAHGGQPQRGESKVVDDCEISLNLAMSVRAPALRSDLLLKTVVLCSAANRQLRAEVLERVFQTASQVEALYPRDPVPVGFTDTEPALSAIASGLGLDQLSLRIRALSILTALDVRKARDWFESITLRHPPALTCDDYQVARLAGYYEMLRELADRSFSPEEVAKGVREKFIIAHLLPIQSSAEVAGVLHFLATARLDARALELLLTMAAVQMDAVDSDDRAFSVQMLAEGGQDRIKVLAERCGREGVNPAPFLSAYRGYYARQLAKPRCGDFARSEPLRAREQQALAQLSAIAGPYLDEASADLNTIHSAKLQDSKAPRDLVVAEPRYEAWFKDLLARGNPGVGQPPAAAVFDRVAREISDWELPDGFTGPQFFQIKALTLARLLQQAKGDEEWNRAADVNAEFFAKADGMQMEHSAEWLFLFKQFLSQCKASAALRAAVFQRLEENRDPAVSVYARLERILPVTPAAGAGK